MGLIQGTVTQRTTYYRSYIYWWETEVNNTNNTSRLNIQVLIDTTNTSIDWVGTCSSASYTIDGTYTGVSNFTSDTDSGWTYSIDTSPTGRASELIMSGSKVILHNPDGSYTANLSTYFSLASGGYGPGNVSVSGTALLTTIPRESTPTSSNFTVGNTIYVNTNRVSTSFTHTLELYVNTVKVLERTAIGANTTITPSSGEITAMYNAMPNLGYITPAKSYIKCTTFSGETQIGSVTNSAETDVTISSVGNLPTIASITWEENESVNKTLTGWTTAISTDNGKTIQNKTKFKINCATGSAQNGASIVSYKAVINGNTSTSATTTITTGLISDSDTLKVSVIDSRGFESTLIEKAIVVLPYEIPYFTSPTAVRKSYPDNEIVTLSFSAKLAKLMKTYGTKGTTYKLEYQFKKTTDVSYNALAILTYTVDTEGAITYSSDLSDTIDKNFSYNIRVVLTDYYTYSIVDLLVPTDTPLISKRKGKVGIGKVPDPDLPDGSIDVKSTIAKDGIDIFSLIYPIGSIYMSVSDTNPGTLFGGTWSAWGAGRMPIGIDTGDTKFDTVEETGGAETVTLDTTMIPSHTHIQDPHKHNIGFSNTTSGSGNATVKASTNWTSSNGNYIENTTATNQNTGGGLAHENMPPYIVCYMFKRTA